MAIHNAVLSLPLSVACSKCGAPKGTACRTNSGRTSQLDHACRLYEAKQVYELGYVAGVRETFNDPQRADQKRLAIESRTRAAGVH
jgi:hypothetical protein